MSRDVAGRRSVFAVLKFPVIGTVLVFATLAVIVFVLSWSVRHSPSASSKMLDRLEVPGTVPDSARRSTRKPRCDGSVHLGPAVHTLRVNSTLPRAAVIASIERELHTAGWVTAKSPYAEGDEGFEKGFAPAGRDPWNESLVVRVVPVKTGGSAVAVSSYSTSAGC